MFEKPVITSVEFMESLNWTKKILCESVVFLKEWDKRDCEYYKNTSTINREFDMNEREHLRNCVKYWKERISNEDK